MHFPKVERVPPESHPFKQLQSKDSLINILSYMELPVLVEVAKCSRGMFWFIIDEENRKRIMNYKLTEIETNKIVEYLLKLMPVLYLNIYLI